MPLLRRGDDDKEKQQKPSATTIVTVYPPTVLATVRQAEAPGERDPYHQQLIYDIAALASTAEEYAMRVLAAMNTRGISPIAMEATFALSIDMLSIAAIEVARRQGGEDEKPGEYYSRAATALSRVAPIIMGVGGARTVSELSKTVSGNLMSNFTSSLMGVFRVQGETG